MSDPNYCGTFWYPQSCPLVTPIDGRGGSCYNTPIPIPVCTTFPVDRYVGYSNTTNSSSPSSMESHEWINIADTPLNEQISFATLDAFYSDNAEIATIHGVALGLSMLTLCNVIVLTPSRKRGLLLFKLLLIALVAQVIRELLTIYLFTRGGSVSSYLQLTMDWGSTRWSAKYRASIVVVQTATVVALGCVLGAFCIQGRFLLVWVKVMHRASVYHCVVGGLVLVGCFAWLYRVAWAAYQVFWVAFTPKGYWLMDVIERKWWKHLKSGSTIAVGVSLGLWSVAFSVSAFIVIWERRKALFLMKRYEQDSDTAGRGIRRSRFVLTGKGKKEVRSAYENALVMIGLVGVESFIAPVLLIIVSLTPWNTPNLDSIILPVILALLPFSSLFIGSSLAGTGVDTGKENTSILDNTNTGRHVPMNPSTLSNPSTRRLSSSRLVAAAELASCRAQNPQLQDKTGIMAHASIGDFERELQEIDRMG